MGVGNPLMPRDWLWVSFGGFESARIRLTKGGLESGVPSLFAVALEVLVEG